MGKTIKFENFDSSSCCLNVEQETKTLSTLEQI